MKTIKFTQRKFNKEISLKGFKHARVIIKKGGVILNTYLPDDSRNSIGLCKGSDIKFGVHDHILMEFLSTDGVVEYELHKN